MNVLRNGLFALLRKDARSDPHLQEQLQPLTEVYDISDLEFPHYSRRQPSKPRARIHPHFKRLLITLGIVLGLYFGIDYLWSDPERWDNWWKDAAVKARAGVGSGLDITVPLEEGQIVFKGSVHNNIEDSKDFWLWGETIHEIMSWKAIRYGVAPVGERRFRKPENFTYNASVVNATEYHPGCPRFVKGNTAFTGDEDCLRLNIFTPSFRFPDKLFPVMVWIHGGGFYTGSANDPRYDPTDLMIKGIRINQPFIFVSVNYRLGVLGFSSSPPPPAGGPYPPHIPIGNPKDLDLNVGFKDQIAGLEWIQENIGYWGGDKGRVTVVGHSAGAVSIGLHQVYSPPNLFRAAFLMSGAPTSFPIPWPHDGAYRTIHPLPGHLGCPSPTPNTTIPGTPPTNDLLIACMRSLSLSSLMEGTRFMLERGSVNWYFPWVPVLEGEWPGSWLNVRPSHKIYHGTYNKIPIVMGNTKDEGTKFTNPEITNEDDIKESLRNAFDFTFGSVEEILEPIWDLYPANVSEGSPYGTGASTFLLAPAFKRASSLLGDIFFQAPRRTFLRETAKDFGLPSWSYEYNEALEGSPKHLGVEHGADLECWFGHTKSVGLDMHHLCRHMTAYLVNFVANMDPNGPGLRKWPKYDTHRAMLNLERKKIVASHDNARLEPIRFLNRQNPMFAR